MSYDPGRGCPAVIAEVLYEDPGAALDWLVRVLGFREKLRWNLPTGVLAHADIELGGAMVMLGLCSERRSALLPFGDECARVVVRVPDLRGHHAHSLASGAIVVAETESAPGLLERYAVRDGEGHIWEFVQG